jgi:hypothetical protein
LFRSTPKYKKYNKMGMIDDDGDDDDGGGGGGVANGDRDDDQSLSLGPSSSEDRCPSTSFPSISFRKVRFLPFLVYTSVISLLYLHGVKLFEETKAVEGCMTAPHRRNLPVPMVTKISDCFILTVFSLRFSHVLR